MKNELSGSVWLKIILFSLVVVLLGITPWPHDLIRALADPDEVDDYVLIAELQPWRQGTWEQAGLSALAEDPPLRAIQYLVHAHNLEGLSDEGTLALGDAYYLAGDERKAAQTWQTIATADRSHPDAYLRLADLYQSHKDLPQAAAILEDYYRIYSLQSQVPPERVLQLGLLSTAVDPASGLVYLDQAAQIFPEASPAAQEISREITRALREDQPAYTYVAAGRVLGRYGYWDLSYYALQQAVELRPDYAEAWAYYAEAVRQTGNGSGFRQLSTAIELNPGSLAANTYMAVYWQRRGDYDIAIGYLEQAAQSDPNNLDLQIDLASAIAAGGDLDSALDIYLQAIDRSGNTTAFPYGELIQFCVEYNVHVEDIALPLAREAVNSFPSQPGPFDWHGLVLYTLGDLLNAERAYQRALQEDSEYAPALLHLGVLYLTEGKAQAARSYLQQAIERSDDPQLVLVAQRHLETSQ